MGPRMMGTMRGRMEKGRRRVFRRVPANVLLPRKQIGHVLWWMRCSLGHQAGIVIDREGEDAVRRGKR
jgi:hypothetical protein